MIELGSTQDLLQNAPKEVAALSVAKAEAVDDASSYKRDVTTSKYRVGEISEKVEQKLARAVSYAHLQAIGKALKEASIKGVDLSAEIQEARTLEEESAFSATLDEGS